MNSKRILKNIIFKRPAELMQFISKVSEKEGVRISRELITIVQKIDEKVAYYYEISEAVTTVNL